MSDQENATPQPEEVSASPAEAEAVAASAPVAEETPAAPPEAPAAPPKREERSGGKAERPPEARGERREPRGPRGERPERGGERNEKGGDRRGGPRDAGRPGGGRPGGRESGRPEGPPEIDLDKLVADSLYLDNQAHAVVARMRDMDSGTRSQLRRLYSAVRRACRATETERQHQFVMLRARLAYTIARHQLRSLDTLERLLLQVTRRNEARGYERFRDLFEAIVAYNE
jgi:CRISPR type III-A-associated protein Csm2